MIERIASVRAQRRLHNLSSHFLERILTRLSRLLGTGSARFSPPTNLLRSSINEYFLLSIENFVQRPAAEVVTHSRVLSQEDREFLAGCLISTEGL